ncbi:tRNA uracil 4-sulfurtransferase ThiI [Sutcliffiella cohnii]|uniref:Probable tRNA sulfurtransferase n=1 Tax=Sutcliffiella cohnii TaxID=33932 RepID=A0A223KTR2_9BACI|nr:MULTISPECIES: tRNA uracil 4-sulfurtransferase ThiI [Sutcliffiella]AST92860.1 tRNA 4-thiouridine(8) synthase ThiI [Sutcliffiella cohnii]MED4016185.1 tRNA 4-thiouridine(8) synthase ThiI [Sutcliffiella cohnii]WBL14118.1 tRNA 4-thiouridine(8) synthase ThiI [Sutcliffiella sp. NC1]
MTYDHILIRFGELSTKGRNRNLFIRTLSSHIKQALKEFPSIQLQKTRDRIFIVLNGEPHDAIIEKVKKIFGIQSFSIAMKVKTDVQAMKDGALAAIKDMDYEGKTFKVSVKRSYKQFELETNELNYAIGSHVLVNTDNLTVDVKNPDINMRVEVRQDATYITSKDIPGAGGLPVGTSGRGMLMLSGGIDSPVAGYFAMKRGVELHAVHFFSPPYTSERAKQKVIDLVKKLTQYGSTIKLHIVPFTEIQVAIQKQVPSNYTMTSTRRFMLKITDELRRKEQGLAIITGESLGQVASQTLESMFAINDVTSTPIIRPLITMDKTEITAIARKIDTYDISKRPFEDCCTIFTPAAPKTKPKLEKVSYYESFFENMEQYIQEAVAKTETITITSDSLEADDALSDLF